MIEPKDEVFYLDKNQISSGKVVMKLDRKDEAIFHLSTGYNVPEHLLFKSVTELVGSLVADYEESQNKSNQQTGVLNG